MEREIGQAIASVKKQVRESAWNERILACQSSGLSVRRWCGENGIKPSTYYANLRKIRETLLADKPQLVPLPFIPADRNEIRIEASGIRISLPDGSSSEQLAAIIRALKEC